MEVTRIRELTPSFVYEVSPDYASGRNGSYPNKGIDTLTGVRASASYFMVEMEVTRIRELTPRSLIRSPQCFHK